MKVVFFGSSDFSLEPARAIADSRHRVAGVVTVPPAKKGRGQVLKKTAIHEWAESKGFPVWSPDKLRSETFLDAVRKLNADVFVVCSYGKILPQALLDIPGRFAVNVHPSLLPRYRGAAPINWQLIRGEKFCGLTFFRMDAGMDSGDIIRQARYPIDVSDTAESLGVKLSKKAAEEMPALLDSTEKGTVSFTPQNHSEATLAPKLAKADGKLDWSRTAEDLHNQVRGLLPWPCAHTRFRGETVRILKTAVANPAEIRMTRSPGVPPGSLRGETPRLREGAVPRNGVQPGRILGIREDGTLSVATGKGELFITQIQRENRNPISGKEFANGMRLQQGECFS